ncbi:YdcH family protein [Ovoidimarina sediminis]|uniref:YdcH family protein n=1 Tax=Ovoidimarina sediminis TaxID=3079856 RepID=UPI002906B99C|nr:DUF465 domain-containing protein [Rhodophyticola sp. MJ-SS7]MDU8943052.1 DUF465 domain-containing protein [Rhodophyticola sp. MJ-SS7]
MSHTPHELAADFPEFTDRIHDLKMSNADFRLLADEYHDLNRQVHRAETFVEPMSMAAETELRRRRMVLKDRIYQMLTEQVAAAE